jgi:DNA-directed RNA polymerase subunit beta'
MRDNKLFRGQQNDAFWLAYMSGDPPPTPRASKQFDDFLTKLKGAGIYPRRDGDRFRLSAVTDADVKALAGDRELRNAETLDFGRNGEPVPGGLFDPGLTGGVVGEHWSKITLHEPLPSPVFEEPIRRLLGLTGGEYRDVIAGRKPLAGKTGPAAVAAALGAINVPKELVKAREAIAGTRKGARDDAVRKLGYLKTLERTGQNPADWVLSAVPVLPPRFRPVKPLAGGRGGVVSDDANVVYKDLFEANQALKHLSGKVDNLGDERLGVYDAAAAALGTADPVQPKSKERGVKGVLAQLLGDTGKHSVVQQKLLGTPVDLSGRAVVVPNPALDMDEIGIPEDMAWDVFRPFVVRRLVRGGVPRVEALRKAVDKDPMAKKALLAEMDVRPVMATRYPVLHKYNVMAFRPRLMAGSSIHTSPIVNKAFALDHDGDTMSVHVPLTDEGVRDAIDKMLPSRNLVSPASFKATNFLPNMEYVQGLYHASAARKDHPPVVFASVEDALKAHAAGTIDMDTPIEIKPGRG